jgi:hypothetical protein
MRERINKLVDKAYSIHEELEQIERELRRHLIDKGKLPEGQALCHLAQLGLSTCRDKLRALREMVHTTK